MTQIKEQGAENYNPGARSIKKDKKEHEAEENSKKEHGAREKSWSNRENGKGATSTEK